MQGGFFENEIASDGTVDTMNAVCHPSGRLFLSILLFTLAALTNNK